MKRIFSLLIAIIGLMLPLAAQARAHQNFNFGTGLVQNWAPSNTGPLGVMIAEQNPKLSLREVAQIIGAQVPGRLSDANLINENGRMLYIVRWEPSEEGNRGRIIIFVVDADTGQIVSRRGG